MNIIGNAINNNEQVRQDITQIQSELQDALATLMKEVGSKLKENERAEIEHEVKELNDLLERLKSGLVWIQEALFMETGHITPMTLKMSLSGQVFI